MVLEQDPEFDPYLHSTSHLKSWISHMLGSTY